MIYHLYHCTDPGLLVTGQFSVGAFLGREKGACDWLQRHPLIYPIFRPDPSPNRKGKVLSTPFARGNLHLVIPCLDTIRVTSKPLRNGKLNNGTQSLILRYSIVKYLSPDYNAQIVHVSVNGVKLSVNEDLTGFICQV